MREVMRKSILDILVVETARARGCSVAELKSSRQFKSIVEARKIGFLAGRILGLKNEAIGEAFVRNHSTISFGIRSALALFKFVSAAAVADRVRIRINQQSGLKQSDWSRINLKAAVSAFRQPVFRQQISAVPLKAKIKSLRPELHVPVWDRDPEIAAKRARVIARLG